MTLRALLPKTLLSLAVGLLVFAALALYGDLADLGLALHRFQWSLLPVALLFTLCNYLLRFGRWQLYLRALEVRDLSAGTSLLIFLGGLAMVVTPGRVGEWLKSLLLREFKAVPFSHSAPVVVAERLTDGLAMLLLAMAGSVIFETGRELLLLAGALMAGLLLATRRRSVALRLLGLAERVPGVRGRTRALWAYYESSYRLFSPANLVLALVLGVGAWFGECLAFVAILRGLGLPAEPLLLLQATFIYAFSTLAGALFLMPGGLGVTEGGLTALSQLLLQLPRELAVAATLLVRLCTLWFGVGLGVLCLLAVVRRLRRPLEVSGD